MSINTYAFLCPGLFLMLAGCTQSPAASSARDAAFSDSLKPAVPADIWQRSPEVTREGRYTLVSVKSTDAQREPLNQLIDITMPVSLVNSVGDGFRCRHTSPRCIRLSPLISGRWLPGSGESTAWWR